MRHPTRSITFVCALVSAVALLAACTPTDRFVAGTPLDRGELEAISESDAESCSASALEAASESESLSDVAWDTYDPYILAPYEVGTVFWVEDMAVYHTNPHCRHLGRYKMLYCGTEAEAKAFGKSRVCSECVRETAAATNAADMTEGS